MTDEEWRKLVLKHKLLDSPFKFNDDACKRELVSVDKDFDGVLEIPHGVLEIRRKCFHSSKVKAVYIPDSVCVIGDMVFYNCEFLTKVRYSSNLNLIPNQCFCNCHSLETLENFKSVISIGEEAFKYCESLNEVSTDIFPILQEIKRYAFLRSGIVKLVLPDTMKYVYMGGFYGCMRLRFADISGLAGCYWMEEVETGYLFNGCDKNCEFIIPNVNPLFWQNRLGSSLHEDNGYDYKNVIIR